MEPVLVAVLAAVVCGAAGLLAPSAIRRLPEPEPRVPTPEDPPVPPDRHPAPPKPLYADVADTPRLGLVTALLSAVCGALVGLHYGWSWGLVVLVPLVPAGVLIGTVDAATRTIPRRLMYPTYALVAVTVVIAALGVGQPQRILWALIGFVVWGGLFFVLFFIYPAGMGYGDVRLAGALGLVVGLLGYDATFVAIVAGALLGGVGSVVLIALRRADRWHVPYGPYLLLGTLIGSLIS